MHGSAPFREVQRFTQPWLWAILAATSIVPTWLLVRQVAEGRAFG